ncbi:MAG: hypothetical protein EU539_07540 [Promethearchaeota archaeon]|nr:MAG: hypothetical protein EU539_07540 [Candidatus Lokiarchaeota archaeon]
MSKKERDEKERIEDLCVVYVLYFDEAKGHIPLMIYPDDQYKDDKNYMRPIKYHSIWFLDVEEQAALDHIDLEYKGYTFFGKKFLTTSKRKKRRAGLEEETPETIVIIISLPNDLEIFGDELIGKLTSTIRENFEDDLFKIIESEIAKDEVIKTPKVKQLIEKGDKFAKELWNLIGKTVDDYFEKAVREIDPSSIKKQKAISYLTLKGIDVSHLSSGGEPNSFSSIKLFDPSKKKADDISLKTALSILNINVIEDSQELEILVKNNTEEEMNDLRVSITHVKEFFEKEIMNQVVEIWYPEEELLFISPILPHIDEYLFFIIEDKNDKKKLLSKRVDVNLLNIIKK